MAPRFSFVPAQWLADDAPLNAADRLVLCVLCQWANSSTGECFPSVGTVAGHSKLSERTVRTSIARLAEVGAITVQRRTDGNGKPTSSLYTIMGYDPPPKSRGVGANQHPPKVQDSTLLGIQLADMKVQISTPNVVTTNTPVVVGGAERQTPPDAPKGSSASASHSDESRCPRDPARIAQLIREGWDSVAR